MTYDEWVKPDTSPQLGARYHAGNAVESGILCHWTNTEFDYEYHKKTQLEDLEKACEALGYEMKLKEG